MAVSDTRINELVKALLTRHWIDVQKLHISCFRGTVRITGEFLRIGGGRTKKDDMPRLDAIELELRRLAGVERVYFDLSNWVRADGGQWTSVEKKRGEAGGRRTHAHQKDD